eukprot:COSAG02_NODE_2225_length_9457_cov_5.020945_2_plen_503_part_00
MSVRGPLACHVLRRRTLYVTALSERSERDNGRTACIRRLLASRMPGPAPMCFTGSVIDRSAALLKQKTPGFFAAVLSEVSTRFLLLRRGAALCHTCGESSLAEGVLEPHWLPLDQLLSAGVRLELPADAVAIDGHDISAVTGTSITVLLGHVSAEANDGAGAGWRVAVEWGKQSDSKAEALLQMVESRCEQLAWCGGRELYHRLRWTDAAAVGHAICATGWHLKALHCGISGQKTVPIEAGAKRSSVDSRTSRTYPRIDPCCIMLVVSEDRSRCLLSHPKRLRSGVWTCLAGFIDSCESVEEAVRRETMEEAGIVVGDVELVSSQPWPLGRGGAELMIACKAVARSSKIAVGDTTEYASLDDVRWFSRPEAGQMLAAAREAYLHNAPFAQMRRQQHLAPEQREARDNDHTAPHPQPDTLLTPGPYAVAYHLIKDWIDEDVSSAVVRENKHSLDSGSTAHAAGQTREEATFTTATRLGEAACLFVSGAAAASGLWIASMHQGG